MRITIYIPDHVEPILEALIDLANSEHPGTSPKASPIFADALLTYAGAKISRHLEDHGCPPRIKTKLEALALVLNQEAKSDD